MSPDIHTETVIHPHDCLQRNCEFLVYETHDGKEYFLCDREVFLNVIEVKRYRDIQAGILLHGKKLKGGFGAVPVTNLWNHSYLCKLREETTLQYSDREMEVIECPSV